MYSDIEIPSIKKTGGIIWVIVLLIVFYHTIDFEIRVA